MITRQFINPISPIVRDYLERLSSHVQDGYCVRHQTANSDLYLCRLKHMSNGNEIILKADLRRGLLQQRTNHVLTYSCDYGQQQ